MSDNPFRDLSASIQQALLTAVDLLGSEADLLPQEINRKWRKAGYAFVDEIADVESAARQAAAECSLKMTAVVDLLEQAKGIFCLPLFPRPAKGEHPVWALTTSTAEGLNIAADYLDGYRRREIFDPLSDDEYTVLRALRSKSPRLVLNIDLAADTAIGEATVKIIIRSLIHRGLAYRPGERTGATITAFGARQLDAADRYRSKKDSAP